VSSLCPVSALQVPIAAGICAGKVACLAFVCTWWLDEVPRISHRRDCRGKSHRGLYLCGSCFRSRRRRYCSPLGHAWPRLCVLIVWGRHYCADIDSKSCTVSRPWSGVLHHDGSYTPWVILFLWNTMLTFSIMAMCGCEGFLRVYERAS
jgi:hypothetical protein